MGEREQVSRLARELFTLAGGNIADHLSFYFVLSGGGDDIVGMSIDDTQLIRWCELGPIGQKIHGFLDQYGRSRERAYGRYCYDGETIADILQKASSQFDLLIST